MRIPAACGTHTPTPHATTKHHTPTPNTHTCGAASAASLASRRCCGNTWLFGRQRLITSARGWALQNHDVESYADGNGLCHASDGPGTSHGRQLRPALARERHLFIWSVVCAYLAMNGASQPPVKYYGKCITAHHR